MPETYTEWCEKVKYLDPDGVPDYPLNDYIKQAILDDGQPVIIKTFTPERPYIPRIKALGEVAYALFDYYLGIYRRVTPNVYASDPNTIWRVYILCETGNEWRGVIYEAGGDLDKTDAIIADIIQNSWSAEKIALLDFIFLCQDRSGDNWGRGLDQFWAFDNAMFWSYKGRFADKRTIRTGQVDHLKPPFEALVQQGPFEFKNGIFSTLYAGWGLSGELYDRLHRFDWAAFFWELSRIVSHPLMYPYELVDDWRFLQLRRRAEWILDKRRFPEKDDLWGPWQLLIDKPPDGKEIWQREWEIRHLETL